jgi:hypothetical protein
VSQSQPVATLKLNEIWYCVHTVIFNLILRIWIIPEDDNHTILTSHEDETGIYSIKKKKLTTKYICA